MQEHQQNKMNTRIDTTGKWNLYFIYFFKAVKCNAYMVSKPYLDSGTLVLVDSGRVHILCQPAVKCEDDDEVRSGPLNKTRKRGSISFERQRLVQQFTH